MSIPLAELLSAIDSGNNDEVIQMYKERGANLLIIVHRAYLRGNKELYQYPGANYVITNEKLIEFGRYKYPYFTEDVLVHMDLFKKSVKMLIRYGNEALLLGSYRVDIDFYCYALKYNQFEIFKKLLEISVPTYFYSGIDRYFENIVIAKEYELFEFVIKIWPLKEDVYFPYLFFSSDLDFIKKYCPSPKSKHLSPSCYANALKTNCPEVLKFLGARVYIRQLSVYSIIRTENLTAIRTLLSPSECKSSNYAYSFGMTDSVELAEFVLSIGGSFKKLVMANARTKGKRFIRKYMDKIKTSNFKHIVVSDMIICANYWTKSDYDIMIKLVDIDYIISCACKSGHFRLLHKILENGHKISNIPELSKSTIGIGMRKFLNSQNSPDV